MPAITLRVFQFVMYSLLIYGFSLDKFTKIAAEDPYATNVNRVGRSKRNVMILGESAVHSYREHVEREWERRSRNRRAAAYFTLEDDFKNDRTVREAGNGGAPDSSPTDQNVGISKNEVNSSSTNTALQVSTASSAKNNRIVKSTASKTNSNENGTAVSSITTSVVISATATPPLWTSLSTISERKTTDIEASSSTLREPIYLLTETSIITRDISTQTSTYVFSSAIVGADSTFDPSVNPTTKEKNNVQHQQDPKEKKTLFAFVTIEILIALLAGAACTVILLVFLVHRLKKRNEGSYELRETLMMKSGATAEEKEVFV
ncbi:syndecan-3-like [Acropora muricata]|uniref:syndecan-3-like n=1 Tax=Acropora muricata TaxID=159855 RepID=UPI0034E53B42